MVGGDGFGRKGVFFQHREADLDRALCLVPGHAQVAEHADGLMPELLHGDRVEDGGLQQTVKIGIFVSHGDSKFVGKTNGKE